MNSNIGRTIPADHPSLPGHFPGQPIVPGVVILDEVSAALRNWRADCQVTVIRLVKFLVPLKPEQPFTISLSSGTAADEIDFSCRAEDRLIMQGRLEVVCTDPLTI